MHNVFLKNWHVHCSSLIVLLVLNMYVHFSCVIQCSIHFFLAIREDSIFPIINLHCLWHFTWDGHRYWIKGMSPRKINITDSGSESDSASSSSRYVCVCYLILLIEYYVSTGNIMMILSLVYECILYILKPLN